MFTVPVLEISADERAELQRRVRAHTTTQRAVKRARVVLAAAEGVALRQIADDVGMDQHQVGVWRRRFEAERLAGLEDRQRSGRPRIYGPRSSRSGRTDWSPKRSPTSGSRRRRSDGSSLTWISNRTLCVAG